ncbi:MAG TPA: DUF4244 domain-containing protein [Arthrobacter sp.]|jgi:hypothetical protein
MTINQKRLCAAPDLRPTGAPQADEASSLKEPVDAADRGNVVELYPDASRYPGAGSRNRARASRSRIRTMGAEAGMATAEYAIATLAAVGFAGLLVFILRSDEVRGFLLNLIRTALALP